MNERLDRVMEILSRRGYMSVAELSQEMDVSDVTVRRYLDRLEEGSLIRRTHGGAYAGQEMLEIDYRMRETLNRSEKKAIGRRAFELIQPGEFIFMDAGTTAAFLAYAVDGTKRLMVVTNSLIAAQALADKPNVETLLVGGKLHGPTFSLVGPIADENIHQFRFTKAFLGASGVDTEEGFTQSNVDEVPVKRWVAQHTSEVIVLADSSKIGKTASVSFLAIGQAQALITDRGIRDADRAALEEKGLRVIVCEE